MGREESSELQVSRFFLLCFSSPLCDLFHFFSLIYPCPLLISPCSLRLLSSLSSIVPMAVPPAASAPSLFPLACWREMRVLPCQNGVRGGLLALGEEWQRDPGKASLMHSAKRSRTLKPLLSLHTDAHELSGEER